MDTRTTGSDTAPRCLNSIGLFQFFIKKLFGAEPALEDLVPGKVDRFSKREYAIYLEGFAAGQQKMANALQAAFNEQEEFRSEGKDSIN